MNMMDETKVGDSGTTAEALYIVLLSIIMAAAGILKIVALLRGGSGPSGAMLGAFELLLAAGLLTNRYRSIAAIAVVCICLGGVGLALLVPGVKCGCLGVMEIGSGGHLILAGIAGMGATLHLTRRGMIGHGSHTVHR